MAHIKVTSYKIRQIELMKYLQDPTEYGIHAYLAGNVTQNSCQQVKIRKYHD